MADDEVEAVQAQAEPEEQPSVAEDEEEEEEEEGSTEEAAADAPLQELPFTSEERMKLSDLEWEIAMDLKTAVAKDPEINPLSDFFYAQYAVFALARDSRRDPPSLDSLVAQIAQLQAFKEEQGIVDTFSEARKKMEWLFHSFPGLILHIGNSETSSGAVVVVDFAVTLGLKGTLGNEEKLSYWLGANYYLQHCSCPDFYTIRKGLNNVVECDGYNMRDPEREMTSWTQLGSAYPMVFASFQFFHTSMFFNLSVALARRLLPSYIHKNFEVGCTFEGRLDSVFLTPDEPTASQRNKNRCLQALKERYENEAKFSLEDDW